MRDSNHEAGNNPNNDETNWAAEAYRYVSGILEDSQSNHYETTRLDLNPTEDFEGQQLDNPFERLASRFGDHINL